MAQYYCELLYFKHIHHHPGLSHGSAITGPPRLHEYMSQPNLGRQVFIIITYFNYHVGFNVTKELVSLLCLDVANQDFCINVKNNV